MGALASNLADCAVITSDNSRGENPQDIIDAIVSGIRQTGRDNYTVIPNRREAIEYVLRSAQKGDVILLAGKGHETYEIDRMGRHPFDERLIVQEIMQKLFPIRPSEEQND
jgi:UDP-N-acetylmuramoyl-L-alanyl-D-glutamate--2,6-diaminopimelate ligase